MARHIGQRLLDDAEDGRRHRVPPGQRGIADPEYAGDAGAFAEVVGQPFDAGDHAQVVEDQGPQLGGQAAGGLHGIVEQRLHAGQLALHRRFGRQALSEPADVHLERGQRLAQLVVQLARDAALFLLAHGMGRRRHRLHLLLGVAQRLLGADPLGDVAQDHGVEACAVLLDLGDRGVDREFLAVAAQPGDDAGRAHPARADAGGAELADVLPVNGAIAVGQEPVERRADRAVARAAEHRFGGGVEQHHALRLVDGDDGIHGRFDDAADARLDIAQGRVGRAVGDGLSMQPPQVQGGQRQAQQGGERER
nr:hypothetical protein [Chitinimonas koreensis]